MPGLTPEEEAIGIRFVDFDAGDLGTPAPGILFDTASPTQSLGRLDGWARMLLHARAECPADLYPVLPVEIRGYGTDTMVRSFDAIGVLPKGVELYHEAFSPSAQVFRLLRKDGAATGPEVFYLFAR